MDAQSALDRVTNYLKRRAEMRGIDQEDIHCIVSRDGRFQLTRSDLEALIAYKWQPIETAPPDQLVMVYSPPTKEDWPDSIRITFDYIDTGIDEGYWYNHGEHYEHYCCVAKPEGSTGPREKAPYTHWMPLPAAPQAKGSIHAT